jgi:predicted tellurium resistance membrane protein TerC
VYVGVTIGIIALRLIAGVAVKMITKYPVLEHTAFVLIGYVGLLLIAELQFHDFFEQMGPTKVKLIKFAGIILITALTLLWSQRPSLQKAMNPALRALLLPMQLFASIAGALIVVITWPFKKVLSKVKKA